MRQTVHFGAGNIGRGFIGALFSESGYHVTFVDVAEQVINKLNEEKGYQVKLAQSQEETISIGNVSGINNMTHEDDVIEAIQQATYLTTAIGPNILPRIAPLIARGLAKRVAATDDKLYVIACENQIGATDILKQHILDNLDEETKNQLEGKVYFFNSAVDRIVPIQDQSSLDVLVEPYYEWVVETAEDIPQVTGMKMVADLAPFIERKLFTVNTGHAVIAYLGYLAGKSTIDETLADEEIVTQVRETLKETGAYLMKEYGLDEEEHLAYINKNIERFKNAYLNDGVTRVGRAPIRKLGPEDRLIRPATQAQKAGLPYTHLAKAIAAALLFDHPEDEEAMKIQEMIRETGPEGVLKTISGLSEDSDITKEVVRQYKTFQG
ncbi:mannitol-1-phosphate 5-dehydrogenase [Microbacterium sp. APC 3898]|uniref:Mannitol-1-phosphate 5-dehydrogenase n=1 Tax=Planococcus notacanthi TaxID=3035188 RepID=A0ABT7ZJA9_9BACL|nr:MULTISPECIES: mannitol-1-phosphate 5-dehydrogenase [Terrabacteria group]MDN3427196.1 mannitol-1-phosphate 5-dehydrogenase [Planococcus sp. APC 4016]MDN3499477.1 mannitol-1-phosphate 5-dehydrogenase [Microbacterium sp. APC 3898]